MYEIIKYICEMNNWIFTYARQDFANLFDESEQKNVPHIFLDPVEIRDDFDEYGNIINTTYTGSFMILVSSDLDELDYDTRYQTYIKPLVNDTLKVIKEGMQCEGENTIKNWRIIEVINVFDYNFDGLVVTFNVDGK
jgi:hypothetical protein